MIVSLWFACAQQLPDEPYLTLRGEIDPDVVVEGEQIRNVAGGEAVGVRVTDSGRGVEDDAAGLKRADDCR